MQPFHFFLLKNTLFGVESQKVRTEILVDTILILVYILKFDF